jgi:peroxiredoxin
MLAFLSFATALTIGGPTTLSGHISHAPLPADSIHLIVGNTPMSAVVDKNGDFQFKDLKLQQAVPTKFEYSGQQTQLYIAPGDRLAMQVDYTDFAKSLSYTGRGGNANNYLAQALYKFNYGPTSKLLRPNDFPKGTPTDASQAAGELRQARYAYLSAYNKSHRLPAAFVREQQVAFDCDWATQQIGYAYKHKADTMPAGYFDFMAKVPVQELERLRKRSQIDNSRVANLLFGYVVRLVPGGQLSSNSTQGRSIYATATRELGDGTIRNWALEMLIGFNLPGNVAGAKAFYQTLKRYSGDSTLVRNTRKNILALEQTHRGKPAPDFKLYDSNKKLVALSDFRGKVIYLDFWGTWCPPCMRQMQEFAPTLRQKLAGKNVVFLYVSVGDAEAKWLQTISSEQFASFGSVHLRSPNNTVPELYKVSVFPSYFIIGRDGNFFQPYAPAPSDTQQVLDAITEALK